MGSGSKQNTARISVRHSCCSWVTRLNEEQYNACLLKGSNLSICKVQLFLQCCSILPIPPFMPRQMTYTYLNLPSGYLNLNLNLLFPSFTSFPPFCPPFCPPCPCCVGFARGIKLDDGWAYCYTLQIPQH